MGSISLMEKVKVKFIMSSLPNKKVTPLPNKKVGTSEKVTPSEEVDKGTKIFDYMKYGVVAIRRKYLDNFEGYSIGPTSWFNLDHEFLERNVLHLNRTSIKNFLKRILKFKILKRIERLQYHLILLS